MLLVLGGAAAYLGLRQRLATTAELPVGMELVPGNALVTLTMTTDENQWTRLRQLGTPESQKSLDRLLVTWRDRILNANGYRFRTDIEPWIGDQVTLAFLPAAGGDGATERVLLVPIEEPLKAQELLSEPRNGVNWVGRDYRDIKIQSIKTATGETLESAVLDQQWLVLASGTSGIEAVIDSFDGEGSMADSNAYRQAIKHVQMPSSLVQLYVNVPAASSVLAGSDALPGINGLVAAVDLLPNGLDIEASTWLGPEDQPVYGDMANGRSWTPERLPESTVLLLSTGSIGPLWQALSEAEQLTALLPIAPAALAEGLKTQTGLDFENDILPWLGREVTFALLPPAAGDKAASATAPMGQLALMAEVSDRDAAEAIWTQLDEVMVSRFRFDVQPSQTATLPMNRLVSYYGGIAMGHGWLDKNVTFFGVGAEVLDAIAPSPRKSLKANQAFQTLLDISPQEHNGYFFIDFDRIHDLQGTVPFPTLPDGSIFSAVKTLGVTTTVQDERNLSYDIFVELPKGRRVKPLPAPDVSNAKPDDANAEE
ncbi:DUF3352 domain-containing protein [Leptolyngbya ectocarpi]|uniref:DUF3352 domain-containing protein n=1 Tax=Leptolyngbya ectocarpi TaxID=1202 RepID=UPI0038991C9C